MIEKKFDTNKLQMLNNPQRLKDISPVYIWDKLNIEKVDVLVEIGAGTAFFSIAFLQQAKASKIFACDISEVMIDWVKENVVPKYPNVVPVKTEEVTVPLDDEIADIVFTINLHHELENPTLTVNEAYRILKPGGRIFIVDYKKESLKGPPVQIRCSSEQVKKQLEDSRFKNINIFNDLPSHFLIIGEKE
jgi:ubiquinone/menaquinone biosynthesis C-methylase UbiE